MDLSQKVAFNTLVQIASKITTVIFGLLTTVLLTTYLGKEGYGDYMYVITLVVLFGTFADWGTATIAVREAAREKSSQARVFSNVLIIRLFLAGGAGLLMLAAAFLLPFRSTNPALLRQGIAFGSLILFLFATKASFGIIFQTKLQMQKLAVADIAGSVLTFLLSWFFVHQEKGLLFLLSAVIGAGLVSLLIVWFLARRTIKFDFDFDPDLVKRLVKESFPMGAILLVFTVDNKIDTVMLGAIKGSGAVGIYAIAYRVYDVLLLGAAYFMNALLPVISANADLSRYKSPLKKGLSGRINRLKRIYQVAFDVLLIMGVSVALITWLFAPLIVKVLTRNRFEEFTDAVDVLRILSLALFLTYFNHLTGYTIVALGKQRPYFLVALTALVFNLSANLIAIPLWSYKGAAIVTILTEGLTQVITIFLIFRLLGIFPSLCQFPKTFSRAIKRKGKIF